MLANFYGLKAPRVFDDLSKNQKDISIAELLECGRNFTINEYLEAKEDFLSPANK